MAVNGDEEPLIELESAGELLGELPRAFQHLINDGRYLFGVSSQVVVSAQGHRTVTSKHLQHVLILLSYSRIKPVSELVSE